jgi:hypothetical protein
LSAHITVTNIGKTAAKAIYIDACMEILDRAQPAHIEWMSRCYTRAHYREETGMLFPSGNISDAYMQKVDQNLIPSSPTPDQSKRFAAGQDYVVVFGRAHYIDVFRQERWTQFCFPVTRRNLSEAARQCVNFATEGQGDYDRNYAKVQ